MDSFASASYALVTGRRRSCKGRRASRPHHVAASNTWTWRSQAPPPLTNSCSRRKSLSNQSERKPRAIVHVTSPPYPQNSSHNCFAWTAPSAALLTPGSPHPRYLLTRSVHFEASQASKELSSMAPTVLAESRMAGRTCACWPKLGSHPCGRERGLRPRTTTGRRVVGEASASAGAASWPQEGTGRRAPR